MVTESNSNLVYQLPQTVYYDDTDCNNTVYHANYLKYMERARSEWLLATFGRQQWQDWQVAFVVTDVQVTFNKPARLYDRLLIDVAVQSIGRCYVVFEHKIIDNSTHEQYAKGQVKVVCLDSTGRVQRLPADVQQQLTNKEP